VGHGVLLGDRGTAPGWAAVSICSRAYSKVLTLASTPGPARDGAARNGRCILVPPMETSESPSGPGVLEPIEPEEPAAAAPPVVAVVVTSDPGPWLEAAIASLAAQSYPALSVPVLDNGSAEHPARLIA